MVSNFFKITLTLFSLLSCQTLVTPIAGNYKDNPIESKRELSTGAKELIEKSFRGLKNVHDYHFHIVGLGSGGTGAWVNPDMKKWYKIYKNIQFNVYMSAAGIKDKDKADQEYIKNILALVKSEERLGKLHIMAFDYHYKENGERDLNHSSFYIPNEYVYKLSKKYPKYFIPTISVHPYRKDAVEKIHYWGKKGIKLIKWLPNSMGIDPSHKNLDNFYKAVKKYDMAILSHTGEEKAVEGDAFQHLGNPLLLKKPLNMGVKVIMAHAASLGDCRDIENNDETKSCFDIFWRMFKDKKYKKNLFLDISAVGIYTRVGKPLKTLLNHPEVHDRLVYGSDYPLPAINILYRTGQLESKGYITEKEAKALNQIYKYNPLLFHFVLMRTVKHPETGKAFSKTVFDRIRF